MNTTPDQTAKQPVLGLEQYAPIRDYAAVGDCHGSALVSHAGSIDWCAFRRFDAEPVFCRLLDAGRGGFWSIAPRGDGDHQVSRRYLIDTNILQTTFRTAGGEATLTDWMPVGRRLDAGAHDYVHLNAPGWLIRRIEGRHGTVTLRIRYRPSRAFAERPVELRYGGGVLHAGPDLPVLNGELDYTISGDLATADVRIGAGQRLDLVLAANTVAGQQPLDRVAEFFAATQAFWREWIGYCRYRGPYAAAVRRSALTLKLMSHAPSGALVAALTTSLPERLGGERNWDYRYCWLRDASFTLYALAVLGYSGEARRFHDYLVDACRQTLPDVQIMYGIGGEPGLSERVLGHLDGYAGSRPVRVGNGAFDQRQIDVYGQVLDLALLYQALGGRLDEQYRRLLKTFAEFVAEHWQEPDQGLWEMRGPARHHVHGKLMSWVALDRAARLFGNDGHDWAKLAEQVRADIAASAVDPYGGYLRQAFDGGVDAAVLLAPMLAYPLAPATLEHTIKAVECRLGHGDFLYRYDGDDGLNGEEGAFLICSFWLADAKLAAGQFAEARSLFERLLDQANDVGLYSEEIDPASAAFLGNFPQAFTHLALIGSAVNLTLYERYGPAALRSSYAARARSAVEASFGWRGVWASLKQCGRVGRVFSSRRSTLAWP